MPVFGHLVHGRIGPFLNSFSGIGWTLLAVIWFGLDHITVVFAIAAVLTPFSLVNMRAGFDALDPELIEMARSFGRRRARALGRVVLPLLAPYVMAAVRIAYGVGWKIALVAELFGADSGLGYLMLQAQIIADAAMVFATCFAIVVIFFAGEKLIIDPLSRLVRYE